MQNESLPSFEPIEQKTTQKRKRTSTTVKEDNTPPVAKKSRGNRGGYGSICKENINYNKLLVAKKTSRNHTASVSFVQAMFYLFSFFSNITFISQHQLFGLVPLYLKMMVLLVHLVYTMV